MIELTDNDLSAHKRQRRPGYDDLIEAVRVGKVDSIIVWQSWRLWRNRRERTDAFQLVKDRRVSIMAVKVKAGRMICQVKHPQCGRRSYPNRRCPGARAGLQMPTGR